MPTGFERCAVHLAPEVLQQVLGEWWIGLTRSALCVYSLRAMQESLIRSFHDGATFNAEVTDLRREIMTWGVVAPLIVIGLGGLVWQLLPPFTGLDVARVICFEAALALGAGCYWLNRSRAEAALRVCAWGALALVFLCFLLTRDALLTGGIAIACSLIVLLLTPALGWLALGLSSALIFALALAQPGVWLTLAQAGAFVLLAGLLVLLAHVMSRALFRTLRWMQAGYEIAQAQTTALIDKSAQLEGALKALSRTSVQLARANEQLEAAVNYAEEARRSKQVFAASVSHELRAPLNLIIGFSEMITSEPQLYADASGAALPNKLLADISTIHRHAQHLLRLVDDILDLNQMDMNYLTIAREPMSVGGVIRSALSDYEPLIVQRGLTATVEIGPEVPDVEADCVRVRQVLLNLLNNALRFTDQGSITVRARLSNEGGESGQREVIISVSDTGIGIAPNELGRIFEPFVQVGRGDRGARGGSGLGLAICKRFVELHGGRMWAESALGAGSTFSFSLPVRPASPAVRVSRQPYATQRREIGVLAVVERSPLLSQLLERHLRGMRVAHFSSVAELETTQDMPEIVLLNTPQDRAHALPDAFNRTPVLQCFVPTTAGAGAGRGDSVHRHLVKPVTREQLQAALTAMLASCARRNQPTVEGGRLARVLIVEDDPDTAYLLGRMVRSLRFDDSLGFNGVTVLKAHSSAAAIALLTEAAQSNTGDVSPVDAVILDLALGANSGFDVLMAMERRPRLRDAPVCVVSGQTAHGEAVIAPSLTLSRRNGLYAHELVQAVAALARIMRPGLEAMVE